MTRISLCLAVCLAATSLAATACAPAEPAVEEAADQAAAEIEEAAGEAEQAAEEVAADVEEVAADVEEAAEDLADAAEDALDGMAMSGEDFVAGGMALSGTTVTVARCSLMAEPMADGQMACRVVDEDGNDIKDANDLPVDIFIQSADLDDTAQAWIAENCASGFCDARITGDLTVSEGTDFREMANVILDTP